MTMKIVIGKSHMWITFVAQKITGFDYKDRSKSYRAYSIFNNTLYLINMILLWWELTYCDTIESIVVNISFSMHQTVLAISIQFINMKNCLKLFDDIIKREGKVKREAKDEIREIFQDYSKFNNQINVYIYISAMITCSFFTVITVLNRIFLYPQHYPFDVDQYYWEIYINQCVFMFLCCVPRFMYVRSSTTGFITYINARLDILLLYLEKLKKLPKSLKNRSVDEQQNYFYSIARACVKEHIEIVDEVEEIIKATNMFIFMDFIVHSVEFGTLFLRTSVQFEGDTMGDTIFSLIHLLTLLTPMIIIFISAEQIKTKSFNVGVTLYDLDWYNFRKDIKEMMMLMMLRSQKELALKVGPFFEMNHETLSKALQASMSYFMFLKTIHDLIYGK